MKRTHKKNSEDTENMSFIKLNINNIRNENVDLLLFRNELNKVINELVKLQNSVSMDIQSKRDIEQRIANTRKQLFLVEQRIVSLYKLINYSMDEYSKTEYELIRRGTGIRR